MKRVCEGHTDGNYAVTNEIGQMNGHSLMDNNIHKVINR